MRLGCRGLLVARTAIMSVYEWVDRSVYGCCSYGDMGMWVWVCGCGGASTCSCRGDDVEVCLIWVWLGCIVLGT